MLPTVLALTSKEYGARPSAGIPSGHEAVSKLMAADDDVEAGVPRSWVLMPYGPGGILQRKAKTSSKRNNTKKLCDVAKAAAKASVAVVRQRASIVASRGESSDSCASQRSTSTRRGRSTQRYTSSSEQLETNEEQTDLPELSEGSLRRDDSRRV